MKSMHLCNIFSHIMGSPDGAEKVTRLFPPVTQNDIASSDTESREEVRDGNGCYET